MRVLIINTDYPDFLRWLYAQHPGLAHRAYAEQMRLRHESLYGVADFYSNNLRILGHEAEDVYANNEYLQKAWAAEQGEGRASALASAEPAASMLDQIK